MSKKTAREFERKHRNKAVITKHGLAWPVINDQRHENTDLIRMAQNMVRMDPPCALLVNKRQAEFLKDRLVDFVEMPDARPQNHNEPDLDIDCHKDLRIRMRLYFPKEDGSERHVLRTRVPDGAVGLLPFGSGVPVFVDEEYEEGDAPPTNPKLDPSLPENQRLVAELDAKAEERLLEVRLRRAAGDVLTDVPVVKADI